MKISIHAEGDVHTPYGATEALPVASISATRGARRDGRKDRRRRRRLRGTPLFGHRSGK